MRGSRGTEPTAQVHYDIGYPPYSGGYFIIVGPFKHQTARDIHGYVYILLWRERWPKAAAQACGTAGRLIEAHLEFQPRGVVWG